MIDWQSIDITIDRLKEITIDELKGSNIVITDEASDKETTRIGLSLVMTDLPGEDQYDYQMGNCHIKIIDWIQKEFRKATISNKVVVLCTPNEDLYTYTISVYKK